MLLNLLYCKESSKYLYIHVQASCNLSVLSFITRPFGTIGIVSEKRRTRIVIRLHDYDARRRVQALLKVQITISSSISREPGGKIDGMSEKCFLKR